MPSLISDTKPVVPAFVPVKSWREGQHYPLQEEWYTKPKSRFYRILTMYLAEHSAPV